MALILDPIKKAFLSLTKAMDRSKQNPEDLEVRDACIPADLYLAWLYCL